MSSGEWEVVNRSKKDKKLTKTDKQKLIENAPKVEDILPLAQVKSLYSSKNNNKENRKPKEVTKMINQPKKVVTKKKPELKSEKKKAKPIKSIECGLNGIDVKELKSLLDIGKQRFPQAPLVWLKDLAIYLNGRTNVTNIDPVFINKPIGYPLSAVPDSIRKLLEQALHELSANNLKTFFELCLSSIAFDMTKGAPVIGYKIFIQLILKNNPVLALENKEKFMNLRNSYQNRQPIGLSLLWCMNQSMYKNFNIGLRIIKEIMLGMIEMKNYTKYIISCIKTFLSRRWEPGTLSFNDYIYLFDLVNGIIKLNISSEMRKDFQLCNTHLKTLLFDNRNDGKYEILFELLLKKLQENQNQYSDKVKIELLEVLLQCFLIEPECFNIWREIYPKNVAASASLLAIFKSRWSKINTKLDKKQFKSLLIAFNNANKSLSQNKKQEESIHEIMRLSKILLDKMTITKSFPWKLLFFLTFTSIFGLIYYDSVQHGGFSKSLTKNFLKDTGLWEGGQTVLKHSINYSRKGCQWLQENGPIYYIAAKEFLTPYVVLLYNIYLIVRNAIFEIVEYVQMKIPAVVEFIESYAPGLVDKIVEVFKAIISAVIYYVGEIREYLVTKVFVGQLSPDNIQRATLEAINTTQKYATRYYDWIYQMISNID